MYQWLYGTTLSGLIFPLTTASGTYAQNYAVASLSSVLSKNGGAWTALGSRVAATPGNGVYSITSLSSVEMQCYSWAVKITANSGTLGNVIIGYNLSGYPLFTDLSGFAKQIDSSGQALQVHVSGLPGLTIATSGLASKTDVSGNNAIFVAVSGLPAISIATSGLASKTDVSGNNNLLTAISGLKNDVSGLPGILTAASGPVVLMGINHAGAIIPTVTTVNNLSGKATTQVNEDKTGYGIDVSSINGVRDITTTDAASLTSGTLAHDSRMVRHFAWNDMVIEKRETPYRQHHWNGTNTSSYFNIQDDANQTRRLRGG